VTAGLSIAAARRIALAAQGFGRTTGSSAGVRQLSSVLGQVAQFQIDSVNVAVRAQYVPLFARLGPYDRGLLDRAAGRAPRRVFEYWGHAASLIDVSLYPALRHRMAEARDHPWFRVADLEAKRPGIVEQIYDEVVERGPLTAREVEYPDAKYALEWLFHAGRVTVATRNAQFERVYDVPERVIPPDVFARHVDAEEARLELVRRAARALGIATIRCLADYFRMDVRETQECVDALVEEGQLVPTPVRGWARPTYLWHEARAPRRIHVDALVSPFDSLVFERRRLLELFGTDFRIEIYTPAAKRTHGYYVYLFVMDQQVAARVDLKADRDRRVLLVRTAWLEPGAPGAETAARLAARLADFASWLELDDVDVLPVGTLSAALAREMGRGGRAG